MKLVLVTLFSSFIFAINAAKIGVFVSTLSKSQIIFGYQIANVLSSDQHEVVIIRADINPHIHDFKPFNFKHVQMDALGGNRETFDNFSRAEHEVIFGDHGLLSTQGIALATIFQTLMVESCKEIISNQQFLNILKLEGFDFIYVNHHVKCAMAVAYKLGVRYAHFSSGSLGTAISQSFGIPQLASIVPAWLAPYTNQMSWIERAHNLLLIGLESLELLDVVEVRSRYQEQFGEYLPTNRELTERAELAFVNDEEFFNYPRPISHKIVYIGGIGEELNTKSTGELSEEYSKFVGDGGRTVLISLGTVANSTEMPSYWKEAFKNTFILNPEVKFIWKYDGKDIESPENVMINSWIPQRNLLQSGKISLFLTHGGYNSLSESLYSGTPLVAIPLFADQFRNANLAKERGVGLVIRKSEFNADFMSTQIRRVLGDPSFKKNVQKYQGLLRNKPFKPSELVVRWNRFLLENDPINLNIKTFNFVQYYCLDIIIPLVVPIIVILSWILFKLLRLYWWSCFGMATKPVHLKNE